MKFLYKACYGLVLVITFTILSNLVYAFGGEVISPFGYRTHPIYGTTILHAGIDIPMEEGTVVPAPFSGYVEVGSEGNSGHGNWMTITNESNQAVIFCHLNGYIDTSGYVEQGQAVAISGNTGGSTGPHLHTGWFPNGYTYPEVNGAADPTGMLLAAGWNLTGDTSGNYVLPGMGIFTAAKKLLPNIDIDYTTFFKPSDELFKIGQSIFTILSKASNNLQANIYTTLVSLMVLDLLWFIGRGLALTTFNPVDVIPRLLRYSFIGFVFKSWDTIIKEGVIPFFESMGSIYGGQDFTAENIMTFDTLFNTLSDVLKHYMHLKISAAEIVTGLFAFIIQNILIVIILFIAIAISVYILCKLINFYALCMLAVLGLPLSFIPKAEYTAGTMIGSIITHLLELIIIAFLYGIILTEMAHIGTIKANDTSLLLLFTIKFAVAGFFISRDTRGWSQSLAGITVRLNPMQSGNTIR